MVRLNMDCFIWITGWVDDLRDVVRLWVALGCHLPPNHIMWRQILREFVRNSCPALAVPHMEQLKRAHQLDGLHVPRVVRIRPRQHTDEPSTRRIADVVIARGTPEKSRRSEAIERDAHHGDERPRPPLGHVA